MAVQSHWFSVGPIVPWARAGVGAVATQANADVAYGPRALELLERGIPAHAALDQLLAADPGAASRQVAVVDALGDVAAYTGAMCIPFAGHHAAEGVSCQANIMATERVWAEMYATFESSSGPLALRLLAALDAGERAGGDLRGRQSAAVLVVPAAGEPWETVVSLRVEDHPDPLVELRRLLGLHDAYALASEADELLNQGRPEDAAGLYRRASALAPGSPELRFWAGLTAAETGELDAGVVQVREAIAASPGWRVLLSRVPAELAPAADAVLARLDEAEPDAPTD